MKARTGPLPFVALAAAALGLIGYGLWLERQPAPAPATPPLAATATPARATVRPGSGTFTQPAPSTQEQAQGGALCPDCDVVVITVCSLRRDHVGAYGEKAGLTPALDALAAESVRFDNAWSASNFTLAGLTAILTGRFGSTTGVTGWDKGLVADVRTLPQILGYYGYSTGAFTIDAPSGFRPDYGLDRGFQHMEIIPPPRDTPDGRFSAGEIGPGGASAAPAAAWVAAQPVEKPIFAMFHTRTAHFPFVVEDPDPATDPTGIGHKLWEAGKSGRGQRAMPGAAGGTAQTGVVSVGRDELQEATIAAGEAGLDVWKTHYAEGVTRADQDIAVLIAALKARGRWDHTIVVVVADHGESLGDHGELLHGDAYWDPVVHVPLLLRVPGVQPGAQGALVSHVDLLPTLLELIGAVLPEGIDGASMLPLLRGESSSIRETTLVEGGVAATKEGPPRGAVIAPPWALLRQDSGCGRSAAPRVPGQPAQCLFNLEIDPGETTDRSIDQAAVVADLTERWDRFRAARAVQGATVDLDPAFVEALHQSGYDFRVGAAP